MTEAKKFESQFLLAADAIVAISAELGHGMMDFSEVGQVEGRKPYLILIQEISAMVAAQGCEIGGGGIPQHLRDQIHTYRMDSQFSEDLNEILEALIDGVDLIWEEA